MDKHQSAFVTFLLIAAAAWPAAAQQSSSTPQAVPSETCAGCFAYLEFPPSLEPESYAVRGQVMENSTLLPAADEPSGRPREQVAGLVAGSKQ